MALANQMNGDFYSERTDTKVLPSAYNSSNANVRSALEFLDRMMNPIICRGSQYVLVDDNPPGAGFTAQVMSELNNHTNNTQNKLYQLYSSVGDTKRDM